MRLSYIIPAYNAERYLDGCLRSLAKQGLAPGDYEILLVDDGSTDSTIDIARQLSVEIPQIRLLRADRLGPGGARNLGVDQAKGERIWFVDADDLVVPGTAAVLLGLMDRLSLDFLSFDMERQVSGENLLRGRTFDGSKNVAWVAEGADYLAKHNFGAEVWRFITSRALHSGGPRMLPGIFCADGIYVPQLALRAQRAAHVPAVAYIYVQSTVSVTKRSDLPHLEKMAADMFRVSRLTHDLAESQPAGREALRRRLHCRADALVLFLLVRLVSRRVPLQLARKAHAEAYSLKLLPLRHFGGPDYPGMRYALLRLLVNSSWMYLAVVTAGSAIRRIASAYQALVSRF